MPGRAVGSRPVSQGGNGGALAMVDEVQRMVRDGCTCTCWGRGGASPVGLGPNTRSPAPVHVAAADPGAEGASCAAPSVTPGSRGGKLGAGSRSEIHAHPLPPSALTVLHTALKVTRGPGTQSPCPLQCQGAHSSYTHPILFLETNVSWKKNKCSQPPIHPSKPSSDVTFSWEALCNSYLEAPSSGAGLYLDPVMAPRPPFDDVCALIRLLDEIWSSLRLGQMSHLSLSPGQHEADPE